MLTDLDLLVIRTMIAKDLPSLEWDGEYTHFRRMFSDAYKNQNKGNSVLWVAEFPGNGLVGQAFVQLISTRMELADGHLRAYIYSVRVKTRFRNLGIGKRIMSTAEEDLRQRGFSYVTLNVGKDNPNAQRFYERLGYTSVAEEPGSWSYLDHKGRRRYVNEPAWRMQKRLH